MTNNPIDDPIGTLLSIAESQATSIKPWIGEPLEIMKMIPNTNVGRVGELFLKSIFEACNYPVEEHPPRGQYDLLVSKKKIEVKTATLDTTGHFQFNGIRYDTKYDILAVVGIAPNDIFFYFYQKRDVSELKLVAMAKNTNSTFKLTKHHKDLWHIKHFSKQAQKFLE